MTVSIVEVRIPAPLLQLGLSRSEDELAAEFAAVDQLFTENGG